MSPIRTSAAFLAAALATVVVAASHRPSETAAGTAPRLDLDRLLEHTRSCLRGVVLSATARLAEDGLVETAYLVRVDERLVGSGPTFETVVVPGGVLPDGSGLLVPGVPRLQVGEETLLFLSEQDPRTGRRLPVGLGQGRYRIVSGPDGRPLAIGVGLAAEPPGQAELAHAHDSVVLYQDLRARIEAARQRRAAEGGAR